MVGLLLVPYNDSMRLGQGFNSFLQEPCVNNAVTFGSTSTVTTSSTGASGVSQVVSYSSRFVEKISDVVRSMNISAGSSIRNGTIEVSGSSLSVDEAKFASSDLNAVVSVKVINQTTTISDNATFEPRKLDVWTSDKFHDIYGDCFISGFIEGGELHGIVSVKVLDATKKRSVESALKSAINNASNAADFSLTAGESASDLSSALSSSETTISVNWSGGGSIKESDSEWALPQLFKVAAAFPDRVSKTPQRTHAILTKYDNNLDFIDWAEKKGIVVKHYDMASRYAGDLLDMYMEYKNNLSIVQGALSNPSAYRPSEVKGSVPVSVNALVIERKRMKAEMAKIVDNIEMLNNRPELVRTLETSSDIKAPEIWATRLPVRLPAGTTENPGDAVAAIHDALMGFSFEGGLTTDAEEAEAVRVELEAQDKLEKDLAAANLAATAAAQEASVAKLALEEAAKAMTLAQEAAKAAQDEETRAKEKAQKEVERAAREVAAVKQELAEAKAQHQQLLQKAVDKSAADIKEAQIERDAAVARAREAEPPESLGVNGGEQMSSDERTFCTDEENRKRYRLYRLSYGLGSAWGGGKWRTHLEALESTSIPVRWPTQVVFRIVTWAGLQIVGMTKVVYDGVVLTMGTDLRAENDGLTMDLDARGGERVIAVTVVLDRMADGVQGAKWVRLRTSLGRTSTCGSRSEVDREITWECPSDLPNGGLKGFHGRDGEIIDRFGPIWGR